jgi:hypothetical protein
VIERSVSPTQGRGGRDRPAHELETVLHRGVQGMTQRQAGGDRGRKRTAGSVHRLGADPGLAEVAGAGRCHQDVGDGIAGEVAAFDEGGADAEPGSV